MFNFFKKRKPIEERKLGTFTAYDIEYVYDFLGEERISRKLEELRNVGTMGIPFDNFVNEEKGFGNRGVLEVFSHILGYFDNDLPLTIFLFEKSKNYNEENYHSGKNGRVQFETHLAMMKRIIDKKEKISKHYQAKLISRYWIDYHFFYGQTLQNLLRFLRQHLKIKRELSLDFEGLYLTVSNKFAKQNFVLEIKKRRNPGIGKYILFREEEIYYDLKEVDINLFEFISVGRRYRVKVNDSNCVIDQINPEYIYDLTNENVLFDKAHNTINDLIDSYIPNLNKVTARMGIEHGWDNPPSNWVIEQAIDFFEMKGDKEKVTDLIKVGRSIPNTWNENYYNGLEDNAAFESL